MQFTYSLLLAFVAASHTYAAASLALADVCTAAYVQSALPTDNFIEGVVISPASVAVNAVSNYSVAAGDLSIGMEGVDFCNVTFSYSHAGLNDTVSR
jgi:tannase